MDTRLDAIPRHVSERMDPTIHMTRENIAGFLSASERAGKSAETMKCYARCLDRLYRYLPEEKTLARGTLGTWREAMLAEGFHPQTANLYISAANSYVAHLGHRELQLMKQLKKEKVDTPELTRAEYLRMLQAARTLEDEKAYFLTKLFVDTGLRVQDLPKITVETVRAGEFTSGSGSGRQTFRIPDCLRQELMEYAARSGVRDGAILAQRNGRPLARSHVYILLGRLCREAQVPEEKASPRCLRQLYKQTYGEIESNVAALIRQAYDQLLETEQVIVGWNEA